LSFCREAAGNWSLAGGFGRQAPLLQAIVQFITVMW